MITAGGTTIQDFVLVPAASETLNGVVSDGSGAGWRLYARLDISGNGFSATLFTDPVTGYYALTLPAGFTYQVVVTSVIPGYDVGHFDVFVPVPAAAGRAPTDPNAFVKNFDLTVDAGLCIAPGYTPGVPVPVLNEAFNGGVLPPGWLVNNYSGNGAGWLVQTDFAPCFELPGNPTGGTGAFALVNSDCDGQVPVDADIQTASFDLSAYGGAVLTFQQEYDNLGDIADVDVSIDGGATWNNVLRQTTDHFGPDTATAILSGTGGQANVKVRWHYYNAFFAWWWAIDDIAIIGATCNPGSGGLVVGTVSDGNTGEGLVGATVKNMPDGDEATTVATPDDPNVADGFYGVFAGSGPQPFEASLANYQSKTQSMAVIPNATVRLDFSLAAGWLTATPGTLSSKVLPGETQDLELTLTNSGNADASFTILEIDHPLASSAIHGKPTGTVEWLQSPGTGVTMRNNAGRSKLAHPSAAVWHPSNPGGGQPSILVYADDAFHAAPNTYIDQGLQQLGLTYTAFYDGNFAGFESALNTGGPWDIVIFGNENFNPSAAPTVFDSLNTYATGGGKLIVDEWAFGGNQAHPLWTTLGVQWMGDDNDPPDSIYWWDPTSPVFTIPESVPEFTQLTGGRYGIYGQRVEPLAGFTALAGYTTPGPDPGVAALVIGDNGLTAFRAFADGQNDADLDSDGKPDGAELWTNLISGILVGFTSDIPWLSEDPTEGTVPAAAGAGQGGGTNPFPVTVTFDSAGLLPGLRQASLRVNTDTPYPVDPIAVNFTVRFQDVPLNEPPGTNPFENFIYGAAGANIMHGCGFYLFCPNAAVTRADMAGYIWRAVHGAFASPPAYTGIFLDVFFGDYNCNYIQGVWDDGITAGCSADPLLYCPNFFINRGQMAVFIEKDLRGRDFVPPPCTGYFGDVPCPVTPQDPYGDHIEQLFNDGITAGCQVSPPLYCPNVPIPNEQMAVFIVKAFELPVLP